MNPVSPLRASRLSKATVLQLLTAALLLLVVAVAGSYVVNKHLWARAKIAEVEPRYERLLGIQQSAEAMHTAQQQSMQLLEQYAYPVSKEINQIGTDVQQKLRTALGGAGLTIQSSQVMQEQDDGALQAIPVEVRAEGDTTAIRDALVALSAQRPLIRVESINIQRGRKVDIHTPIRLNVQARFVVWRQPS